MHILKRILRKRVWFQVVLVVLVAKCSSSFVLGQGRRTLEVLGEKVNLTKVSNLSTEHLDSGRWLLAAHNSGDFGVVGVKGGIQIWNLQNGQNHTCLGPKKEKYEQLSLSMNAERIAGYKDGTITVWRRDDCQVLFTVRSDVTGDIYLSPNGRFLSFSTGSRDGMQAWAIDKGKPLSNLTRERGKIRPVDEYGRLARLTSAAFSPGNRTIAVSYYYWIALFEIESGKPRGILRDPTAPTQVAQGGIYRVTYSLDGKLLASSGADGTIKIWEVDTRNLVRSFNVQDRVWGRTQISDDSKYFATGGSKGGVTLWEVSSGRLLWKIDRNNRILIFSSPEIGLISMENGDVYDITTGTRIKDITGEFMTNGNFLMDENDGNTSYWRLDRVR